MVESATGNPFRNAWDLALVASAFEGISRFEGFRCALGISRQVLAERLRDLVADGILDRARYQVRPERYEYVLTAKGRDLRPVIEALAGWCQRWCPSVLDEGSDRGAWG